MEEAFLVNPVTNPWRIAHIKPYTITVWRKHGKMVKPGTPGAKKSKIHFKGRTERIWQTASGKIGRHPKRKTKKTRRQKPMEELALINPWETIHYPSGVRRVFRGARGRFAKPGRRQNPLDLKGFGGILKESAMLFVGFAGSNYLFGMLGTKVPVLAKPPIKAIAKLGLALLLEKKVRPIALGMAVSGIRDAVASISPQLAGQLSAFEQYLPEPTEIKEIESNIGGYLPEAKVETVSNIGELAQEEEF